MKKVLFLLIALAITSLSFSQAPQGINYQGVARNTFGDAISNAAITVQFQIHQGSAGGTVVFNETQSTNTDTFGLYSLVIGQGGGLSSVNWSGGQMFLQITVNGTAVATTKLQSVPYALYSGGSATGITSVTGNPTQISAVTTGSTSVSLDLANTSVTPNTYGDATHYPVFTVDQYGRLTFAASQTFTTSAGTVTSLTVGAGMSAPGTIITSGVIDLPTLGGGGTVGSATAIPVITYDQYGRIIGVSTQPLVTSAPQTLSLSSNTLSISGGNAVTLPTPTSTVLVNTPLNGDGSIGNPIKIPPANNTTDGYLSQTDWNTFNNKVGSIMPGIGISSITGGPSTVTITAANTNPIWNASQLNGQQIATGTPTAGQILQYNASGQWIPTTISGSLPIPMVGSLLYSNSSNAWTATNPSNISSDGNSITVVNTTTVTAGTFSSSATSGSNPVLQVTGNSSQGTAIEADNSNGAGIVANSWNGPYAIEGNITAAGGVGNAIEGQIENGASGNAIAAYIDATSTGKAGIFFNSNTSNTDTTLLVLNKGTGYSGSFNGGKGLQTDQIKITGTSSAPPLAGYVLTSDALGNGTWQSASASSWLTTGNTAGATDFIGTNNPQPLIFKTNGFEAMRIDNVSNWLGIGTGTASLISQLDVNGNAHLNTGKILLGPVGGINQGYTGIYGNPSTGDLVLAVFKGGASGGSLGSANSLDALTILGTSGNVGIGTTNPAAALEVDGPSGGGPTLKIVDGNQALGKILTSDGAGNATWQAPMAQTLSLAANTLSISGGNSVTLPPPGVAGASNGLSVTTGTVELGGTLTNNTTITQAANNMIFNGAAGNVQISNANTTNGALAVTNTGATNGNALNVTSNGTGNTIVGTNLGTGGNAASFINNSSSNGAAALNAYTGGTSNAGFFQISNAGNNQSAIAATTNGSGSAINASSSGSNPTILSTNGGTTGGAGSFQINTAGNAFPAIVAATNGTGSAISASNNGTSGSSGIFQNNTASNSFPTLNVITNSTSGGPAIFAQTTGSTTGNAITATTGGSGLAVYGQNTGAGGAANFIINNAGNNSNALSVTTNGGGAAISAASTGSGAAAIIGTNSGTGYAGSFSIANTGNSQPAINVNTNGTGGALYATTSGTAGSVGSFANNSTSNSAPAVDISNSGNGPAIYAINNFNGNGSVIEAVITTAGNSGSALFASTSGTGIAGNFLISNASSSSSAVSANSNGSAGAAVLGNSSGGASAIYGTSNGTGYAGYFQTNNAGNTLPAVEGTTNGSGPAVEGITTGTGNAASFSINNAGNSQPAVVVNNNGSGPSISATTGGNGTTIQASTIGTGNSGSFSGGAGLKMDGMTVSIVNLSTPTTLTGTNYFVEVTANTTITLPLASANQGRVYIFINPSTAFTLASQAGGGGIVNTTGVTLAPAGSSTLIATGTSTHLISDGTNWREW